MREPEEISCEEVRRLMGIYLDFDSELAAIGIHFKNCSACQQVWRDNRRISLMVKHAVEIETLPAESLDKLRRKLD